jgi:c-di-GMP-binding flagellar brake protein YcgR
MPKNLQGLPLQPIDRRKHTRVKTSNLISYYSFDETGKLISHGLGIALDISKGGILLETPYAIESGPIVLAAVDSENNLVEVKGKSIYSVKESNEMYRSGVEFVGIDEGATEFILNLIKDYNYRGYKLFVAVGRKIQDLQSQQICG